MNGTPWGYIHQKKRTDEALSRQSSLERENNMLKLVIKKLRNAKPLSKAEEGFLNHLGL